MSKQLLYKDLCARLPYGLKVKIGDNPNPFKVENRIKWILSYGSKGDLDEIFDNVKPYLRPIEKMTEVEKKDFADMFLDYRYCQIVDFFNEHMIDYHKTEDGKTMIEAGLAIEAPKGMYIFK